MRRIVFRPCTPEDKGHEADCPNGEAERRSMNGPSQVASDSYRKGWDSIRWGSEKLPVGQS